MFTALTSAGSSISILRDLGLLHQQIGVSSPSHPQRTASAHHATESLRGRVAQGSGAGPLGRRGEQRGRIRENQDGGTARLLLPKQTHVASFEAENQRLLRCFFFFNYLKEFCKFLLICCERAQSSPNHLFIFLPCPLLPTILRIAPSGSAVAEREGNMPQCGGWINPSFLTPRLESRGNQRM